MAPCIARTLPLRWPAEASLGRCTRVGHSWQKAHLCQRLPSQQRAHDGRRRGGRVEGQAIALALPLHSEAGGVDVERSANARIAVGRTARHTSGLQYEVMIAGTNVQFLNRTACPAGKVRMSSVRVCQQGFIIPWHWCVVLLTYNRWASHEHRRAPGCRPAGHKTTVLQGTC